jgi:hypothetical protein
MSVPAGTFGELVPPEPVSPELVLVDPELAERERARLREKARLQEFVDVAALRRAVAYDLERQAVDPEAEPIAEERVTVGRLLRTRLLPAALLCSLLANGYLAADLVARSDREAAVPIPVAQRPATTASYGVSPSGTSGVHSVRRLAAKSNVERKLVSLLLTAPTRKLPRAFVDPRTGLVRNNVQVVCRAVKDRSYLCTIRLPRTRAARALVVRYRSAPSGADVFQWYGYRRAK